MKYSVDQVMTFIHAVVAGSFTQAAEQLCVSKSVVSQRISALERHLQAQLFVRTTRKLILTDVGTTFYNQVKGLFSQIEAAIEAARTHQEVAKGKLTIFMPYGFARLIREQFIPDFLKSYPQVHLNLNIVDDLKACLDDPFDCMIFPHIKGVPLPDFTRVAKTILFSEVGIYATPTYLKEYGRPNTPKDLNSHNCVAAFSGQWPFKQSKGKLNFKAVSGNISVNNDSVLKSLVMNHQAIGYTYSRLFKDEAANKEVVSVLNDYTNLQVEVYALYPQSYYIPYKLKVFLNMLQAYYLEAAICKTS